jgi:tetratricopeptide (TPR) repeat protein
VKRALLVLALAGVAHANVWQQMSSPPDPSRELYDKEMREADEYVLRANSESASIAQRKRWVQLAIASYKTAAAARPKDAEPYFRIAATLNSFYLDNCLDAPHFNVTRSPFRDCSRPDVLDLGIAQQVIDALDNAEKRAPLDPRFSGADGDSMLFERAILNTKIGTPKSLDLASKDYERYLERNDGKGVNMETTLSNLAETYMMLGRLDESIDAYREIGSPTHVSTIYGAAVALDRNDRSSLAMQIVREQGKNGYEQFRRGVENGQTFFVPQGEQFYYFALAEEAFGNVEAAINYWNRFIGSGAHPMFQPRAKAHVDALMKKRGNKPALPPDPFLDIR